MKYNKEKSFIGKKHLIKIITKSPKNKSIKNPTPIKGPWTFQEDLLLKQWVEKHGPKSWRLCANNIPGRNRSQCRQHWYNKLKPNLIVGNWSSEEIFLIIVFYKKFKGSWKKMIPLFKTRTENSIKNIFFSQTRSIVSKIINEKISLDKKRYDLPTILKYYDIIYDETKKKFLEDNPMSEDELEKYLKNIEKKIKKKSKYINENKNEENKREEIKEFKNLEKIEKEPKIENEIKVKIEKNRDNDNIDISNINNINIQQYLNNNININNNNNIYNDIKDIPNDFNSIYNYYSNNIIRLLLNLNNFIYYNIIIYILITNLKSNINNNNNINSSCLFNNNQINNINDNNIINLTPVNENNLYNSLSKNQVDLPYVSISNGNDGLKNKEEKNKDLT